jgi:arylsulfatase A-like enzyme
VYFSVGEDRFILGVREHNWKYLFDLRQGDDELFDLDRDPDEQHNLASVESARSARLRQHLAAWMESNRKQYLGSP